MGWSSCIGPEERKFNLKKKQKQTKTNNKRTKTTNNLAFLPHWKYLDVVNVLKGNISQSKPNEIGETKSWILFTLKGIFFSSHIVSLLKIISLCPSIRLKWLIFQPNLFVPKACGHEGFHLLLSHKDIKNNLGWALHLFDIRDGNRLWLSRHT